MREIEDAHEALDRVKNHVDRMRWIIQNPGVAECIIVTACSKYDRDDERGLAIVRMIDEARGQAGYADQWPQRTIDQMLARRSGSFVPNKIEPQSETQQQFMIRVGRDLFDEIR